MGKRSASTSPRVAKRQHSRSSSLVRNATVYPQGAAETWIAIGNCATAMGIVVAAIRAFDSALTHAPNNVDALVGWSHLLRMNDLTVNETVGLQSLIQRLNSAAEAFPEVTQSATFFRELAECYLLLGLNEQAHQAVQQALQRTPGDAALCLLLAQTLIRAGARAQAAGALAHCLLLLPTQFAEFSKADIETARSAHAELAAIAAADGNIDLSIAELTATLLLPPPPLARTEEHIALWCALATAKERANRIGEALEACERAEVAAGPLPRILITHAYLCLLDDSKENAQKAVLLLNTVVDAEPTDPREDEDADKEVTGDFLPWYLLGKAYTLLDAPRAAYDAYQIALRRASSLPITWLAVGKLYLELKQLPDALAAYSQALRLQLNENTPGTAAAWDGLSCVYERCDDQLVDAADACLRAAMCFRVIGDAENADYFDERSKKLHAAALGSGPVPELGVPVGVPNFFLRDLVTLLPAERIAFVQHLPAATAHQPQPATPLQQPSAPAVAAPPAQPQHQQHPPQHHDKHIRRQLGPMFEHPQQPAQQYLPVQARSSVFLHKLPPKMGQPLPPPARTWQEMQPHGFQMPPALQGQFPAPNGMMTPPPMQGGPQRSPLHPHLMQNGYPVAGPPGYVYGLYMPVHGGVLTHVQPYVGNWRQ